MPIPESQLQTWSHQGAIQSSAATHKSVSACIDRVNWNSDVDYITYLQGSYPNATNIYGNSDVDLVVEFRSLFSYDITRLDDAQKETFNKRFPNAKYSLASFKQDVIDQLKECYGKENVVVGDKAILVKGGNGRLDCDVLVCNPYRKYKNIGPTIDDYIEGILFRTEKTNKVIINYPKVHLKNGQTKNQRPNTNGNFKPTVRVLKNMKAAMVAKGSITSSTAPSYFLECLIYNSSNVNFRHSTYSIIVSAILNQFHLDLNSGAMENYLVQNEQRRLFGSEDQQWNIADARLFVNEAINFWNNF